MQEAENTKTKKFFRINLSGLMFSESLKDKFIKADIEELGGIILMPNGENVIVFIDIPKENLEKIKDYLLMNSIKILKIERKKD